MQRMNCPMDIMAEIMEEETIQYPDRVSRMLLRDLFDKDLKKSKRITERLIIWWNWFVVTTIP